MAPKRCFIPAEAIESEVGQIGQTQKATRELNGRIDSNSDEIRVGIRHGFRCVRDAV